MKIFHGELDEVSSICGNLVDVIKSVRHKKTKSTLTAKRTFLKSGERPFCLELSEVAAKSQNVDRKALVGDFEQGV